MTDDDKMSIAVMRQRLDDHIINSRAAEEINERQHIALIAQQTLIATELKQSMAFQNKMKFMSAIIFTIVGAIAMFIYHYAPWFWNLFPMHDHTH